MTASAVAGDARPASPGLKAKASTLEPIGINKFRQQVKVVESSIAIFLLTPEEHQATMLTHIGNAMKQLARWLQRCTSPTAACELYTSLKLRVDALPQPEPAAETVPLSSSLIRRGRSSHPPPGLIHPDDRLRSGLPLSTSLPDVATLPESSPASPATDAEPASIMPTSSDMPVTTGIPDIPIEQHVQVLAIDAVT